VLLFRVSGTPAMHCCWSTSHATWLGRENSTSPTSWQRKVQHLDTSLQGMWTAVHCKQSTQARAAWLAEQSAGSRTDTGSAQQTHPLLPPQRCCTTAGTRPALHPCTGSTTVQPLLHPHAPSCLHKTTPAIHAASLAGRRCWAEDAPNACTWFLECIP
jgi:hypothetical protein